MFSSTHFLLVCALVGAVRAQVAVPNGYKKGSDGYYYKPHGQKKSWNEAQRICKGEGGNLAIIFNQQTRDVVRGFMSDGWIGASDQWGEGKWQTPTREDLPYTSWAKGEPNNMGGEDCTIQHKNKKWNDLSCGSKQKFICQIVPAVTTEAPATAAPTAAPTVVTTELAVDPPATPPTPQCFCAAPNADIICKENQKKEMFYTDDICKCPKYRCIWEVCPAVVDIVCPPCEVRVEVDDCGCKQYECQKKPCERKVLDCGPCEKLEQSEDQCGCPVDKCVKIPKPKSQCPCGECQTCSQVEFGPSGCGLDQEICIKKPCPKQDEKICDRECETVEFKEDNCGCMSYGCKKVDNSTIPVCDECHEPTKRRIERCNLDKYECTPKRCERPDEDEAVCFERVKDKKTKCGCPKYKKKTCDLVPAGDCPKGTVAQGGFDLCGCPHQICVPCSQVYPPETCKHECEIKEKVTVANGQCEQEVCVAGPDCGCPKPPTPPKCEECEVLDKVKVNENCLVDVCVPSTAKECVCKEVIDKAEKSCGKCEVRKKTAAGPCKGIRTCQPKDQKDCPDLGAPNCLACEKAEVIEDECGCLKYKCSKRPCTPLTPKPIDCSANGKTDVVEGKDDCGCDAKIVVPCNMTEPPTCDGTCHELLEEADGCCKKWTCQKKPCPKVEKPECPRCHQVVVHDDECSCCKSTCEPIKCPAIKRCPAGEKPTIVIGECNCPNLLKCTPEGGNVKVCPKDKVCKDPGKAVELCGECVEAAP